MLNLRVLIKYFSSRLEILPPGFAKQRSIVEYELKNKKEPEFFLRALKDTNWSSHQQIYGIQLFNKRFNQFVPINLVIKEYHDVLNMILSDISCLDYLAILDFVTLLSNSTGWKERIINKEKCESLSFRIHELIESNCYNKAQLISIHKALKILSIDVANLSEEIEKIVKNPMIYLNLQEIADIMIGFDRKLLLSFKHLFNPLINRVAEIKSEDFHPDSALSILSIFKKINYGTEFQSILMRYIEILEEKMKDWSEYELLLAAQRYSEIKIMPWVKQDRLWNNITEILLNKRDKIGLGFLIEILKFNEAPKEKLYRMALNLVFQKVKTKPITSNDLLHILKSSKKVSLSSVNSEILKKILENFQFANTLELFEAINHISFIKFSNDGNISWFSSILNFNKILNFDKKSLSNLDYDQQFLILEKIFTTNSLLKPLLQPWSNFLIENISQEISDPNRLCRMLSRIRSIMRSSNGNCISPVTFKELKAIQQKVYKFFDSMLSDMKPYKEALWFSSLFYESDPNAWIYFIEKNKRILNDAHEIDLTVKFTNEPFEKINLLLSKYDIYSAEFIRSAMLRLHNVTDNEFSNFLTHINNIRAENFTIQPTAFIDWHFFWKIWSENKTNLISDLLDKIYLKMQSLPYSKNNIIHAVSIANLLNKEGKLTQELANKLLKELDHKLVLRKELIIPIILASSNEDIKLLLFEEILNSKINSSQFINMIDFILEKPREKNIENIITKSISNVMKNYNLDDVALILMSRQLFKNYQTEHSKLVSLLLSKCSEIMKHQTILLNHVSNILSILPYDWQNIISPNSFIKKFLQSNERSKISTWSLKFIQKMAFSGYRDDIIFQILLSSKNTHDEQFFPDCLSFIADFRLEDNPLAIENHSRIIEATENDKIVFDSNLASVKYCYGLIRCGGKEAEIQRHFKNAKEYEVESSTFKHILIDNHLALNYPDWNLHQKHPNFEFNYLSYFGIDQEIMNQYKHLFKSQGAKVGDFVNGIWVPLYIPLRQIALWPVSNFIFFYQSQALKGEFYMYKNQLSQVCKKVIFLPKIAEKDFNIHEYIEKPSVWAK